MSPDGSHELTVEYTVDIDNSHCIHYDLCGTLKRVWNGEHILSNTLSTLNMFNLQNTCFSFVNRFRYINNNVTKDRCPIPMDMTVRLGPLKFSLQATIDHHGPSIDSGHYTASINCCKKKHFIATITKLRSLELLIKTPLLHIILYKWIDTWFLNSNRRVGVWSLPWRWHILSIPLTTGRGTSAETCGLDDVFPPDDLGSRPEALC